MGQFQCCCPADSNGCAEHATGVLQHEVHHLWGDFLCGTDEVALILTVFVVDHYDELAFPEVGQCLVNGIQFEVFHISLLYIMYAMIITSVGPAVGRWV